MSEEKNNDGWGLSKNQKIIISVLLVIMVLLIPVGLMIHNSANIQSHNNSPSKVVVHQVVPIKPQGNSNNTTSTTTSIPTETGTPESKNNTVNETLKKEDELENSLITKPYEKYLPPVKPFNYNGHKVWAVIYFDAKSQPCIEMEGTLYQVLGQNATWVRQVNGDYDNQVRLNYITKILYGRYYSYYVVPISAIFIDDKLAVVLTGSWSPNTVKKIIDFYLNNAFVGYGRFAFIDIVEAQQNHGTVTAKIINSKLKYNALIDLFLQKGKYKYNRVHILAEDSTS